MHQPLQRLVSSNQFEKPVDNSYWSSAILLQNQFNKFSKPVRHANLGFFVVAVEVTCGHLISQLFKNLSPASVLKPAGFSKLGDLKPRLACLTYHCQLGPPPHGATQGLFRYLKSPG